MKYVGADQILRAVHCDPCGAEAAITGTIENQCVGLMTIEGGAWIDTHRRHAGERAALQDSSMQRVC